MSCLYKNYKKIELGVVASMRVRLQWGGGDGQAALQIHEQLRCATALKPRKSSSAEKNFRRMISVSETDVAENRTLVICVEATCATAAPPSC